MPPVMLGAYGGDMPVLRVKVPLPDINITCPYWKVCDRFVQSLNLSGKYMCMCSLTDHPRFYCYFFNTIIVGGTFHLECRTD